MTIQATGSLKTITPYKAGESSIDGAERIIKLSANELPYPPSPQAIEAFHATGQDLGRYPDGSQTQLRRAISKVHGVPEANIFAGNGSEEAIGLVIRAILAAGDEIVISENSFLMAEIYARSVGAEVIKCPEADHHVDVGALIAGVTERTKIVYLCSPNNPTGTYTNEAELLRLEAALPDHVLLMIDAAYSEFVIASDYDDGLKSLFAPSGRVVVTHTFSKAYGLAAQRIGWAAAPDTVMKAVAAIRTPFNTNMAALNAAEAAVRDQAHLKANVDRVNHTRDWFVAGLEALGLTVVPSQTNFVLILFVPGGNEARSLDDALKAGGVLGRPVWGGVNEFRISIGTDEEMQITLDLIGKWVAWQGR